MKVIYTENKEYVLKSDEEAFLGSLKFEKWSTAKAHFTTQFGEFYDIDKKGFWGTSIIISKGGYDFAELKWNWKGQMVIDILASGQKMDYLLKLNSIWKSQYALQNRNGNDLVIITPEFKWSGHYDFKVEINPDFTNDVNETLLLIAIYGVLYLLMMSAAAAS